MRLTRYITAQLLDLILEGWGDELKMAAKVNELELYVVVVQWTL